MNLELEKMELEDCPFLNALRNECVDFLHDSRTFTVEQTKEWFKTLSIPYYIIWVNNERAGYVRLSNYENNSIYIGCDISPNHRRKGIAYMALSMIIPRICSELSINKIYAEVLAYNLASENLYRKLGFQLESVKKDCITKHNKLVDSLVMSLTKNYA